MELTYSLSVRRERNRRLFTIPSLFTTDCLLPLSFAVVRTPNYEPTERHGLPLKCVKCQHPCLLRAPCRVVVILAEAYASAVAFAIPGRKNAGCAGTLWLMMISAIAVALLVLPTMNAPHHTRIQHLLNIRFFIHRNAAAGRHRTKFALQ